MKKIGRLKNDTKWNYGISFGKDFTRLEGYELQVWIFKQSKPLPEASGMVTVDSGFWWTRKMSLDKTQ
jgi:hypothetical protein